MNTSYLQTTRASMRPVHLIAGLLILLFGFQTFLSGQNETPAESAMPVGSMIAFGGPANLIPEAEGWLLCDGRELSNEQHSLLFARIGFSWGRGSAPNTFRIPDLRGRFLRGVDLTPAVEARDPERDQRQPAYSGGHSGNQVGTIQADEFKMHHHALAGAARATGFVDETAGQWVRFYGARLADESTPILVSETSVVPAGGAETRPKNASVHWIIKAR